MAKGSRKNSTPNVAIPVDDVTPPSARNVPPLPPLNIPYATSYNPSDADIIEILRRKIHGEHVEADMVNKVNLYTTTPDQIVERLNQYMVKGNPHYLDFTKTTVLDEKAAYDRYDSGTAKKVRRDRKVGSGLMGYWRPDGERVFINEEFTANVVGSKLRFSYDDGHLRKTDTGMQRSVWCMWEYTIDPKLVNIDIPQKYKYTISKIFKDPDSSHIKAFQDREAGKAMERELSHKISTLSYRGHRGGATDKMEADRVTCINTSTTTFPFESELVDKFRASRAKKGQPRSASMAKKNKPPQYRPNYSSELPVRDSNLTEEDLEHLTEEDLEHLTEEDLEDLEHLTEEDLENLKWVSTTYKEKCKKRPDHHDHIPISTGLKWSVLNDTELDRNRWGKTPQDFLKNDQGRVFYSDNAYVGMKYDKYFMALLLKDRDELGAENPGWLNSDHICTWIKHLIKIYPDRTVIFYESFAARMAPRGVEAGGEKELDDVNSICRDTNQPDLWNVNYAYTPINAYGHWYLAKIDLHDFHVTIYDSAHGHFWEPLKVQVQNWSEQLYAYLCRINFWKMSRRPDPKSLEIRVERDDNVPRQSGGDCGIWVCRNLELLIAGEELNRGDETEEEIATSYRKKMAEAIYKTRCE